MILDYGRFSRQHSFSLYHPLQLLQHPYFQVSYVSHIFTIRFISNRKRNILGSRTVSNNTPANQQHYPTQLIQYFDKLGLTFTVQHPLSQTYEASESCFTPSGKDWGFCLKLFIAGESVSYLKLPSFPQTLLEVTPLLRTWLFLLRSLLLPNM